MLSRPTVAGGDGLAESMPRLAAGELAVRAASAAVLAPLALATVWTGGLPLAVLLCAAGALIGNEWFRLFGSRGVRAYLPALSATGAGVALWTLVGAEAAVAGAVIGAVTGSLVVGGIDRAIAQAYPGILVLAIPLTLVWELRQMGDEGRNLLVWCLLVVWATDTFAYLFGRGLGGWRLAPAISPQKTWSGLCGGVLGAALTGAAAAILIGFSVESSALAGAGVGLTAIAGDLAMSAIKRARGCKDTSRLIPGHGGILDRVDGFLFSVTVVAVWVLMVRGT